MRIVNAAEASRSNHIRVGAFFFFLSGEIQFMLQQQPNNIHGGSVKSIKHHNVHRVHAALARIASKQEYALLFFRSVFKEFDVLIDDN